MTIRDEEIRKPAYRGQSINNGGRGERRDSKTLFWNEDRIRAKQSVPCFSPIDRSKNKLPFLLSPTHPPTPKHKASHARVALEQSWELNYRGFGTCLYTSSSLELLAFSNTTWVIISERSSLCFTHIHSIVSAATTLKPLSTPKHSGLRRKVRDTMEEQEFLCKLLLPQKKSWGRHRVFYFTHHKQTNNPQIGNPELTKALTPLGFEKGQCFCVFLLCYHYLHNKSLQTTIMSDVGNKLFGA